MVAVAAVAGWAGARATEFEVRWLVPPFSSTTMLVRCRHGGGAGGWLVHAGGVEVALEAVPGFFPWRRCGGELAWAGLAKNVRQAWC